MPGGYGQADIYVVDINEDGSFSANQEISDQELILKEEKCFLTLEKTISFIFHLTGMTAMENWMFLQV